MVTMMQVLRNNMKLIFVVVLGAFLITIIFSWGMGGFKGKQSGRQQGIVGEINGYKVHYQQYARVLEQELAAAREKAPDRNLPEYQVSAIQDRVWDNMVQEYLMSQEVKRLNIEPTAQEIVYYMKNFPPDFVRNNEQFLTDGEFDMAKYQEILADSRNFQALIPLENYFRNALPLQKLRQWIASTIRITDEEVEEAYRLKSEKNNVKYLSWDPRALSNEEITVSDKEIKDYYKTHQDNFKSPATRTIDYIAFDLVPSSEDTFDLREDILDYKEMLNEGEDFSELAKIYSHDAGTAENGGDLGFISKGTMVKPFEDAVFSGKVGDIIGPVQTQYGFHLIKILARKFENGELKVQAQHILRKYEVSPETRDDIYEAANTMYEELKDRKPSEFARYVEANGLTLKTSKPFVEGAYIPEIGASSRINNAAFREKAGWVSPPMSTDNAVIVFQIKTIQPESIKPLEEVKTSVENLVIQDKKMKKAEALCQNAWDRVQRGMDLEAIASEDSMKVTETGLFALNGYVKGIGKEPKFIGAASKLGIGEISKPVETKRGFYLIQCVDKVPYDPAVFASVKDVEKQSYLRQKQEKMFTDWFANLKKNANIKDFRKDFF